MLPDFRCGNLATISKCASKAITKTTPFTKKKKYIYIYIYIKPNSFKALKAKANSLFLTANV